MASLALVLLDDSAAAAWGRPPGRMTIHPLTSLTTRQADRIEAEALAMPAPAGTQRVACRSG